LRATAPACSASFLKLAMISSDEPLYAPLSSHCTFSASRPWVADQKFVASTATPVGISTTCRTPGIFCTAEASNDVRLAPKRGACATTAVSMSGSLKSWVKIAVPFALARASLRAACLPM
jgi:hypothetical protein